MKANAAVTCLVICGSLLAREYTVKDDLTAYTYNDILETIIEQEMRLTYDTEQTTFFWYIDYTMFPVAIQFPDMVRRTLSGHIQKYKQWREQAIEESVEITKEIGTLPTTVAYFKYGESWERDSRCVVHLDFLSLTTKDHVLVIYMTELTSDYNEFITLMPDPLFLWWEDVLTLEGAISDEAVREYMEEVEERRSTEEEFQ